MAKFQPVRLAYISFEPEEGTDEGLAPVVFLHGVTGSGSWDYWTDIPQTVANATKRKAYSLDFRNHGDSDWSEIFSFDIIGDDLLHFMDERGIQKAITVGHSMGGRAAILAALKKPDRFEKVVVEDMTVSKISRENVDAIITNVSLIKKGVEAAPPDLEEDEAKKFALDYVLSNLPGEADEPRQEDRESEDHKILRIRRGNDGHYVLCANIAVIVREMLNYDTLMSDPQGMYEGPAYFIYGNLSTFGVSDDEEVIKKHFPNAVLVCIDGATHKVHMDKPMEFKEELLKFLS